MLTKVIGLGLTSAISAFSQTADYEPFPYVEEQEVPVFIMEEYRASRDRLSTSTHYDRPSRRHIQDTSFSRAGEPSYLEINSQRRREFLQDLYNPMGMDTTYTLNFDRRTSSNRYEVIRPRQALENVRKDRITRQRILPYGRMVK